jgi:hypothetical protein
MNPTEELTERLRELAEAGTRGSLLDRRPRTVA